MRILAWAIAPHGKDWSIAPIADMLASTIPSPIGSSLEFLHAMTRQTRTIALALCVASLFAIYVGAQTGRFDDDLRRAQEILNQLATTGLESGVRASFQEELASIEAREYVVPVKLQARKYTAGSGYFPVTISKLGLLEPPMAGRIEMPRSMARRAKSQLNPAHAALRVRSQGKITRRAVKALESVWVTVDGKRWAVTSADLRLEARAERMTVAQDDDESEARASTELRVPGEFGTIQQAIDAARPGDTVVVSPGRYAEQLVLLDGVTVRGAGSELTTLTFPNPINCGSSC